MQYPLDDTCYLYAAEVSPIKTVFSFEGVLGVDMVMDGLVGTKDMTKLHQSYRFTGGILEAIAAGPSDGMVPINSALAKGNNRGCNLRSVWQSTYNHTQVATEAEIHRQMARDLWQIYQRLNPNWQEIPTTLALPDPSEDLLAGFHELPYRPQVEWASAACADPESGQLFVFDANKVSEVELGAATLSWPSWNDRGQLLVNRKTQNQECPVLISGGRVLMLVPNATLAGLDSRGDRWVYWKDDKLWLAELANRHTACALVADAKLRPVAPPIICGDFVYFATSANAGTGYTVWRVSILARDLQQAQMVGRDVATLATGAEYYPTAFGHDVAGVGKLPDDQLFFKMLNRAWYPPNFEFRGVRIRDEVFGVVSGLVRDPANNDYYMVADGWVRRVPPEGIMDQYEIAKQLAGSGQKGDSDGAWSVNEEAVVRVLTRKEIDWLFPPVVSGSQLAARP